MVAFVLFTSVPMLLLLDAVERTRSDGSPGLRTVNALFALVFTSLSCLGVLFGFILLSQLQRRNPFDHRYEGICFLLAALGGIGSLSWLFHTRNLAALLTLIAACWIGTLWLMALATL